MADMLTASRGSAARAGGDHADASRYRRATTTIPLALAAGWTLFIVALALLGGVSGGVLAGLWFLGVLVPAGVGVTDALVRRHERRARQRS